jgi:membrane-bound lytic murein transglycosylase B
MHSLNFLMQRRFRPAVLMLLVAMLAACAATPPSAKPAAKPDGQPPPRVVAAPAPAAAEVPRALARPIAAEAETQDAAFARWVAGFRLTARAAGITDATLQNAFASVQYLPRVVELDRAQPEFTRAIWDYLDVAVSEQRVARGQDKWILERQAIDAAAAQYGVPAPILVAIWGIESNYGSNFGGTPVIDALSTLGFDGRREDWARGQLLAALRIVQAGDIAPAQMIGSWAGAMGQTQFLPSVFLAYAVDADGDGRRDIWGSSADVMASTAHFLARSGWQAGQAWGTEVQLPAGFDMARADGVTRRPSTDWAAQGVRTMNGTALPDFADGAVLLPAGARGPAFLVGPNFRVLLRYNNATSYALAVGLLAQRIDGGPAVQAAWPRDLRTLSRSEVLALQTALNQRGFDSGVADGIFGSRTRDAVRRYQRSVGLPADGYPDGSLLDRLAQP